MNYTEIKDKTSQKFNLLDFQPGDIFSEMFSYWEVIIQVKDDNVIIVSGHPSNGDLKLKTLTKEEFKYHCQYKHTDGYWIDFMGNNTRKAGDYIEAYIEQMKLTTDETRDFKLELVL